MGALAAELTAALHSAGASGYPPVWRPMPRAVLERQVSEMINNDTCPRPTTGPRERRHADERRGVRDGAADRQLAAVGVKSARHGSCGLNKNSVHTSVPLNLVVL